MDWRHAIEYYKQKFLEQKRFWGGFLKSIVDKEIDLPILHLLVWITRRCTIYCELKWLWLFSEIGNSYLNLQSSGTEKKSLKCSTKIIIHRSIQDAINKTALRAAKKSMLFVFVVYSKVMLSIMSVCSQGNYTGTPPPHGRVQTCSLGITPFIGLRSAENLSLFSLFPEQLAIHRDTQE